ncbi:MAG: VOC family protein [Acidimicrobiia bacterium]
MTRPHNRINHVAWVVKPENIDRYVHDASLLFGVEFERLGDPDVPGATKVIFMSFDGGLEFIAPLTTADASAKRFQDFLDEHGEGLYGLVFAVDSLDDRIAEARTLGYPAGDPLQSSDPSVRQRYLRAYTTRCLDAQEAVIGRFVGTAVVFGEFDYPDQASPE